MAIHAPHDALFKFTFQDPKNAAGALAAVLPAELTAAIDLERLELQPGSFVDVELKARHTDLLYRTTLTGRPCLVYLLFEHQSRPDPTMPLRMLEYITRIWRARLREAPEAALPPIIPVVLYHGAHPWTAPRRLAEMFDTAVPLARFGDLLPAARFIVDDLTSVSDDALRARSVTSLTQLALGTLKHCRDAAGLLEWLARSGAAMVDVWRAPNGLRAFEVLTRYILSRNEVSEREVGNLYARVIGEEAREVVVTTAQRLFEAGREEGREEGREAGREEGREEGRAKERRLAAHTLLTARFGALDEAATERFDALDLDSLALIFERIFTVDDLGALLTAAEAVEPPADTTDPDA